jgi:hypothetical protein
MSRPASIHPALRRSLRAVPAFKPPHPVARQVSQAMRALVPPGASLRAITFYWREIVGAEIAAHSLPEKLGGRAGAKTLTLLCRGSASPLIENQKTVILERITSFAGRPIATKIALKHWANAPSSRTAKPTSAPTAPAREQAQASVARVKDPKLQAALRHLGERLYQRELTRGRAIPSKEIST